MTKITAVETILDPQHPILAWVRLHTDSGLIGLGETFQSPRTVAELIHETLAKMLVGQDPTEIELLWHHMFKAVHYAGYAGAEMRAISAIDIALWDLLGKLTNQPIYVLLGGACRQSIPTYNTCIGHPPFNDHERFHADPAGLARELLSQGIRAMKIWPFDDQACASLGQSITPEQLEYGVSRFRAIREAVGDNIEVALEGHCCWNLPSAVRIAQAVEPYRPMWLEELMPPDSPAATRQLRESTRTPLVTSERLMTALWVSAGARGRRRRYSHARRRLDGRLQRVAQDRRPSRQPSVTRRAAQSGWPGQSFRRGALSREHVQLVHHGKRAGFLSHLVQ